MKTQQILDGIVNASCKAEFSAHMDLVEQAIERGGCDYDRLDGELIELAMLAKSTEFESPCFSLEHKE